MPLNITITNPDGTKFIMENGEVIENPHNISIDRIGRTIEFGLNKGNYTFTANVNEDGHPNIGVILSNTINGVNVSRLDYKNIDINNRSLIGTFSSSPNSHNLGIDNNNDNIIDESISQSQ